MMGVSPSSRSLPPRRRRFELVRVRTALTALAITGAVTGAAALLQWIWAGWSPYDGPGPSLPLRWLLTTAAGSALLVPPAAAMSAAAVGRRIADAGLRDQVRVTRRGPRQLAVLATRWALAPLLLAVVASAGGWMLMSVASLYGRAYAQDVPGCLAIAEAHAVVLFVAMAFALWGLALGAGSCRPAAPGLRGSRILYTLAQSGVWAPVALALLVAGPALVGPLLPHLARPERALDAALLVNPVTAVGAAIGMDILRSPRVYEMTRAPEYWYSYPTASATAGVYMVVAWLGLVRLRYQLERE
jgi:hypothetical protein